MRRGIDATVLARSRIACYNTQKALEAFAVGGLVSLETYREGRAKQTTSFYITKLLQNHNLSDINFFAQMVFYLQLKACNELPT